MDECQEIYWISAELARTIDRSVLSDLIEIERRIVPSGICPQKGFILLFFRTH